VRALRVPMDGVATPQLVDRVESARVSDAVTASALSPRQKSGRAAA
jgi:hypothetical protein